ncbi:BglII/BstYI family type II restriction endonuclease [Haloferax volcanii]|uniref:Restriction endonuclease BglII n=1 Tax=Haloferax volcanii JCM 10717 TaxID=1227458 RepID=M0IAF3_HALVO|nr:BglII/BstYI family type II restriction endonuclease [Haloferax alexandrinus]ELZ92828.1 Restriction endonuclease BglII [Haloferax alexandrinus JCM 10717]
MEIVYTYSHFGGSEILELRYPELNEEINEAIEAIENPGRGKISEEATNKGEELFSPKDLNEAFENQLEPLGWENERKYYTTSIPDYEHEVTGSYNEYDFKKEEIFVEVQMGKYFAMFYDLAKFQNLFNKGELEVGIEIVPSHFLYRQMSSGVSYGEKLVYDLERIGGNFPQVPVKVILLDMPLDGTDYMLDEREKVRESDS